MAGEYYALCATQAALDGLSATNLSIEPHPNEYIDEAEQKTAGDGSIAALGFPGAVWTYDVPLSISEWNELMTIVGTAASVTAYIRTRTNQVSGSTYEYKKFQCVMHRPTGESLPRYRYDSVTVKFTHLVAL